MCYIQITTVCNMSCPHCCMSCGTNIVGKHMDRYVYQHALDFCAEYDDSIVLGGGEPTLHPHFTEYLAKAINCYQVNNLSLVPWFATNGSVTDLTLELIENAHYCEEELYNKLYIDHWIDWEEEGLYGMAVSKDLYHDPIDEKVFRAARLHKVEIRDVSRKIVKTGHAVFGSSEECVCPSIQIKPDGDIFLCGCDDAPRIGNVINGLSLTCELHELMGMMWDDYCTKNLPKEGLDKITQELFTQKNWVDINMPIKRNKHTHPDTHRIPVYNI